MLLQSCPVSLSRSKVAEVERELMQFKAKYVLLLSDRFKITIPSELAVLVSPVLGGREPVLVIQH